MNGAAPEPLEKAGTPTPAPPPLLWRGGTPQQTQRRTPSRQRRIFQLLCWMLALVGMVIGLLTWLSPVPRPVFAPLWVSSYQSRLLPPVDQGPSDRTAIRDGNYFPRILPDAYASQDRTLMLRDLEELQRLPATEALVVYVAGFACTGGRGEVYVLPADVDPGNPATRLPLRKILEALRDCPAREKLLVLDIMQPLAELNEPGIPPGRLGVLADDVSSRIVPELDAVPDANRLVLTACSPGQVTWTSQTLGHSVFGYYFEEGLRGWADVFSPVGQQDGRVSVHDLATYMTSRVERWAWRNLAARQAPQLLGSGRDFALLALDHGVPRPHLEFDPPDAFPEWLAADWQTVERWRGDNSYALAPRLFRQIEAVVVRAEQRWLGDAPRRANRGEGHDHAPEMDRMRRELARERAALRMPEPRSLALARAQGQTPSADVEKAVAALLTQWQALAKDQPPEKAGPAQAKLLADFKDKHKATPHFDLAWAVFAAAAALSQPTPETMRLLDDVLKAQEPHPQFIETLFLRRLALLAAETSPASWPTDTVPLALQVEARGALAESRPRSFRWVRGPLAQASQARFCGATYLFAQGYVSPALAGQELSDAAQRYATILIYQDAIERGQQTRDDGMVFLPSYVPYLEWAPYLEKTWIAATEACAALDDALQLSEDAVLTADQVRVRVDLVSQRTAAVESQLRELRRPFQADALKHLVVQTQRDLAGPALLLEIRALLVTPYLGPRDRATIWKAGRDLAVRLHEQTAVLDRREDTGGARAAPGETDTGYQEGAERERALLRGRMALALLRMGGLRDEDMRVLDQAMTTASQPRAEVGTLARLAEQIQRAWVEQLPAQLEGAKSLAEQERLAWIVPPFDYLPVVDTFERRPRFRMLLEESRALWAWLAQRYLYHSRDQGGATFYFEAARDYSQQSGLALPTVPDVQIGGLDSAVRLDAAHPRTTVSLHLRFVAPRTLTEARLRLRTADDDWLQLTPVLPASAATTDGAWLLTDPNAERLLEKTVAIQVALKLGAERSGTPRPRGFLAEVTVADHAFHYLVPVQVLPEAEHPRLVLSADPQKATAPLGDLRLRAVATPQPFYLYVHNPADKPHNVVVELSAGGTALAGARATLTVPAKQTQRVTFPPLALPPALPPTTAAAVVAPAGPALLPELAGPLVMRVLDAANPSTVHETRELNVKLAHPREYVAVAGMQFDPPQQALPNLLSARLQARGAAAGPPATVELLLPPERIPGLLGVQAGTFRGVLPPEGKELRLFASGLRFAEGAPEQGTVYLNVDSYARAFIFRTTFARTGTPTTPQEDYRPALRVKADRMGRSEPKFTVTLEVDNAPASATLELGLGRQSGTAFQADAVKRFPGPRQQRIGFSPFSPDGALLFDAQIKDWTADFDTSLVVGPRLLRARLLSAGGDLIIEALQPIRLIDRPPGDVEFIKAPKQVLRGSTLDLQAMGFDAQGGIKQVLFFAGKPVDGKRPPMAATIPGTPVDGGKSTWSAKLPLTPDKSGPIDISVEFVNQAGLSSFATTSVDVVDKLPPQFGTVRGTVVEGNLPQPNLDVVLQDEKGMAVKDEKLKERLTKTGADGAFAIENVPPGKYKIVARKPITNRSAKADIEVQPGETTTVPLVLFLE